MIATIMTIPNIINCDPEDYYSFENQLGKSQLEYIFNEIAFRVKDSCNFYLSNHEDDFNMIDLYSDIAYQFNMMQYSFVEDDSIYYNIYKESLSSVLFTIGGDKSTAQLFRFDSEKSVCSDDELKGYAGKFFKNVIKDRYVESMLEENDQICLYVLIYDVWLKDSPICIIGPDFNYEDYFDDDWDDDDDEDDED